MRTGNQDLMAVKCACVAHIYFLDNPFPDCCSPGQIMILSVDVTPRISTSCILEWIFKIISLPHLALQSTWPWSIISCLRTVLVPLSQCRKGKGSHRPVGRVARMWEGPFFHGHIGLSVIFTLGLLQQSHHCSGSLHSSSGAWPSRTKSLLTVVMSPHHDIHCSLLCLPLTTLPTQVLWFSNPGKGQWGQILCLVCGQSWQI